MCFNSLEFSNGTLTKSQNSFANVPKILTIETDLCFFTTYYYMVVTVLFKLGALMYNYNTAHFNNQSFYNIRVFHD